MTLKFFSRLLTPFSRTVLPRSYSATPPKKKIFIMQALTLMEPSGMIGIQKFMDWYRKNYHVELVLGNEAKNRDNFKKDWELQTGKIFTPKAFKEDRKKKLLGSDGVIYLYNVSVSRGFEIGMFMTEQEYNPAVNSPLLILIKRSNPMKTTLLKDLPNTSYAEYEDFNELVNILHVFDNKMDVASQSRQLHATRIANNLNLR